MDRVRSLDRTGRGGPARWVDEHRAGLVPTEPTVAAHELLEGGDLTGCRVHPAHHDDVTDMVHLLVAKQVRAGSRAVPEQRVLALDHSGVQKHPPAGTEGDRAVPMAAHDDEPDAGMADQAPNERRMQELQVFEIGASGHLRQVDHGQVPGRDNDKIWSLRVECDLTSGRAQRDLAVVGPAAQNTPAGSVTGVTAGDLGEQCVDRAPVLDCAGGGGRGGTGGQQTADGVGEGASVALAKRRTLTLSMIGKGYERVRALDVRRNSLQHRQHPVDALQGLQGLPPVRSGMVGHLVVVDEVAEHHGHATGHLLGDEGDVEVTQQDVGQPA